MANEHEAHSEALPIRIASRTDIGHRRQRNEDYLGTERLPLGLAFVVCDGMGGHAGGDRASRVSVDVFLSTLRDSGDDVRRTLESAVERANRAVLAEAEGDASMRGMGTTLVGAVVDGSHATVVNVGDSRGYHLYDGRLTRITNDHSMVGEWVAEGKLSDAEARVHPHRNIVTRAIGIRQVVQPDIFEVDLSDGDAVLLASDGLHGMIDDAEIERILRVEENPERACDRLIEAALAAGGDDNVSVIVLRIGAASAGAGAMTAPTTLEPKRRRGRAPSLWVLLPLALVAAITIWLLLPTTGDRTVGPDPVGTGTIPDTVADSALWRNDSAVRQLMPGESIDSLDGRTADTSAVLIDRHPLPIEFIHFDNGPQISA